MGDNKPATIDAYIAGFPEPAQQAMQQIRALVLELVSGAAESISYDMPTFKQNGHYVIYFAAYKNHIGLYPAPVHNEAFRNEFAGYKTGRGSIQLPLDRPMPLDLIRKIVQYQLEENLKKSKSKQQ